MEAFYHGSLVAAIFVLVVLSFRLLRSTCGKYVSFNRGKESAGSYPPGPTPWPLLGNPINIYKILKNPEKVLLRLAGTYGGTTWLWLGSQPVLLINNGQDAKALLDNKGSIYSDRPKNDFRQRAWPWRLAMVVVGPQFRFLRSINHRLLGPQQSLRFRHYQDYEASVMLMDLIENPTGFLAHAERFSISVIFSTVYGVRLAKLDHPTMTEFYDIWATMMRYAEPGTLLLDYFPFLEYLPERFQPWEKCANDLRKRELVLHGAFLDNLKIQVQTGTAPNCFGAELMKIREDENIDDGMAIGILSMLIGAGADATSSVLQSVFKIMAMNPRVFRTAQEELDRVVGSSRLPTWEDEINLPYLRATIKEMHRWAPIASLGFPHATSEEDWYLGHYVPQGTIVIPNIPALSRDPQVYEDPESFCPERFLGNDLNAAASAKNPDFRKRDHFHYGFGRRFCQGIFVAEASLYIAVARVIWTFAISIQPGAPPLDMGDKFAGMLTKPKPCPVRIVLRSNARKSVLQTTIAKAQTDVRDFDYVKLG